uniref:BRCA1-associated ATM activator 1 n=1 Tax=Lygus hesperus TaxID=30085 RepID=A0A0A9ZG41_LYGHE
MEAGDDDMMPVVDDASKKEAKSPFGLPERESEVYRKLILVLLQLLEPEFKTSDDTVLPKLLDFIKAQGSQSKSHHEVLMRILCEWLKKVCESWSNLLEEAKVFALKVAGYVVQSPTGCGRFMSTGSLSRLLSYFQEGTTKHSNAIDLGYLCLIEPMLSSADGSRLISDTGVWKDAVKMALSSSSIYCLRQSTKVLALMLSRSDDSTAETIMREITFICTSSTPPETKHGPVYSICNENGLVRKPLSLDEDRAVNTLNTCRMVFYYLMEEGYPPEKISNLINSCKITEWSWGLIQSETPRRALDAANKFICVLNSLSWYQKKDENGRIPYEDSKDITDILLNHFSVLISASMFYQLIDACVDYHTYLHKFGATVAPGIEFDSLGKQISDVPFCLHNVLFLFQCCPVLLFIKVRKTCTNQVLEEYIDKLFRITDSKVMRVCYMWRDVFVTAGEEVCVLATVILQKFTQMCPIMMKEQGVLLFQALTHLLREFTATPEESVDARVVRRFLIEGDELMSKYPALLSACLNCLKSYLNKFDFSWRDSLESLVLQCSLQNILDSKSATTLITVDALKVIDLVLRKFMPPNLALLVDTLKGSSIELLGPQLFRLLHSVEWSIRDSTLEMVRTLCSLSESRFPAFQTLLIDNKLIEVVYSIIETDHEPFVRASAVSCLYELAKVPNVWKASLSDKNVIEKLLLILHHETEGIVRVATAKTITALYSQRKISSEDMKIVYDVMSHSAQNDLHWEVKIECLEFWNCVMHHTIVEQGMIDGTFPDFVFSKQEKKIVKLTPEEIANRIMKSLKILSDVGCLQVLHETFHNEPDLAVQRKSGELIKKIAQCTIKYKVKEIVDQVMRKRLQNYVKPDVGVRENPTVDDPMEVSHNNFSTQESDDVIELIVARSDMDLVSGLVPPQRTEVEKELPQFDRIVMSDDDFVQYIVGLDVDQVLATREKWISNTADGINSLLDDILMFSSRLEDSSLGQNAIDCY